MGWSYHYDVDNRLVEATRDDGRQVRDVYDALGRRLAETCGGTTRWFGWDGDILVDEQGHHGEHRLVVFGADEVSPVLELQKGQGSRLVAHDAVSLPWLYLDQNGNVAELEVSAWGEVVHASGAPGPIRFAGQQADPLTGLHYNRNRSARPSTR